MLPSGEINYTELVKGGGFESKFKELDDNAKSALSNNPEFTTSLLGMLKDQGSFVNAAEALKVINPYMSLVLRVQAESERIVAEKNKNTPVATEPVTPGDNARKSLEQVAVEVKNFEDAIEYNPSLVKKALLAIMNLDPQTQNLEGEVKKLTDKVIAQSDKSSDPEDIKKAAEIVKGTAKIMAEGIRTSPPRANEQQYGNAALIAQTAQTSTRRAEDIYAVPDLNGPYGGIPGEMKGTGSKDTQPYGNAPKISQGDQAKVVYAIPTNAPSVQSTNSGISAPPTSDYDKIDAARRMDAAIAAVGGTSASGANEYAELTIAPNDGRGIASGVSGTTISVPGGYVSAATEKAPQAIVGTPYHRGTNYTAHTTEGVSGATTASPTPVADSATIDAGPETEDEKKKVQEIEGKDSKKEADKKSKSEGVIGFLNKDSTKRYFFGTAAVVCAFVAPPLAVMFAAAMIVNELTPVLKPVFAVCAVAMMIAVETAMNLIKAVLDIGIAVKNLFTEEKTEYLSINFDLTKQTFDFMKDAMKSEKIETKAPAQKAVDDTKKHQAVSDQKQMEKGKSAAAIPAGTPSATPTPSSSTSLSTTTAPSAAHSNAADVAKQTLTGASAGSYVPGLYTSAKSPQNER